MLGTVVNERYKIISALGQGGMAQVWKSEDLNLNRIVALKTICLSENESNVSRQRFAREARVCSSIAHRNVISILDYGSLSGGELFYTMEYLPYPTLSDCLKSGEEFTEERILKIVKQLANALSACHEEGVIHRDVKAANVFLKENDEVVLADFGLVHIEDTTRVTATGSFVGTPLYLPPEALLARKVDERSDIYQLGLLFYELLTGHTLFSADKHDLGELFSKIIAKDFDPPSLLELPTGCRWQGFLQRCLARDVELRFANTESLLQVLDGGSSLPPIVLANKGKPLSLEFGRPLVIGILLGVLVGFSIAYLLWSTDRKAPLQWSISNMKIDSSPRSLMVTWHSAQAYPSLLHVRGKDFSWTSPQDGVTTSEHSVLVPNLTPEKHYFVSVVYPSGKQSLEFSAKTQGKTVEESRREYMASLHAFLASPSKKSGASLLAKSRNCDLITVLESTSKAILETCCPIIKDKDLPFIERVEKCRLIYSTLLKVVLLAQEHSDKTNIAMPRWSKFFAASKTFFRYSTFTEDEDKKRRRKGIVSGVNLLTFGGRPRYFKTMSIVEKQISSWRKRNNKVPLALEMLHAVAMEGAHYITKSAKYAGDIRSRIFSSGHKGHHIDLLLAVSIYQESLIYYKQGEKEKFRALDEAAYKTLQYFVSDWQESPYGEITFKCMVEHLVNVTRLYWKEKHDFSEKETIERHRLLAKRYAGTGLLTVLQKKITTHDKLPIEFRRLVVSALKLEK